jgi:hypothetical protein
LLFSAEIVILIIAKRRIINVIKNL